jgi:transcriptional regulator with XRE-family HTH domain
MKSAKTATEIGKLIKFFRQKKNLSQVQLAKKCHMTQVSISKIENGIGGTLKALEKILKALEMELGFRAIQKIDTTNLTEIME